ncbi:MAG: helical backbone metal receptor [Bradymonadia bacterium]
MRFTDALGRHVDVPSTPRRIVSLVPSQTELLADLGLDDEVVGITRFCIHPKAWCQGRRQVGGTKNARVDEILSLRPDLVIANKEENTRPMVEALAAEVPVYVTDVGDVAEGIEMIRALGALVGRAEQAHAIADEVVEGFEALSFSEVLQIPVAYFIWRGPYMAAGSSNFIHDVLERGGMRNVVGHLPRYPEITLSGLKSLRPQWVLLSSEPYPFKSIHMREIEEALPGVRCALVDGELFSWYGSRMRRTPAYLAELRRHLES